MNNDDFTDEERQIFDSMMGQATRVMRRRVYGFDQEMTKAQFEALSRRLVDSMSEMRAIVDDGRTQAFAAAKDYVDISVAADLVGVGVSMLDTEIRNNQLQYHHREKGDAQIRLAALDAYLRTKYKKTLPDVLRLRLEREMQAGESSGDPWPVIYWLRLFLKLNG